DGRRFERKRSELYLSGTAVRCDHDPAGRDPALKHREARRHGTVCKQALAGAERNRECLQPELVDQIVLEQRLNQVAASVNLELWAIFGLELLDLSDHITADWHRRFPFKTHGPPGDNVFGRAVDPRGGVVVDPGPVCGEDVVRLPAEKEI